VLELSLLEPALPELARHTPRRHELAGGGHDRRWWWPGAVRGENGFIIFIFFEIFN
jgi:hypothetical protein